jgi:glycosyltransferase involved in cell wall biosynthesis
MQHEKDKSLIVGLELGEGNGGPYKTIQQFREAQGGLIVSVSSNSIVPVRGDGIVHLRADLGFWGKHFLKISGSLRLQLADYVRQSSHVQCHILFRYHAHVVWREARKWKRPYWVIPHGCLDPYVFTYRRILKVMWMYFFGKKFLHNAQWVIFATNRELAKARPWMTRSNAVVIRWPVRVPTAMRNRDDALLLRSRLRISERSRVLVTVGRLHPMKRPLEAAELFRSVCSPDSHLVFVGNDDSNLGSRMLEICKNANIHWLGALYGDAKESVVRGADGYWSYSIRENFNHAAVESMASGLPVILSPGNDLCDDLKDEKVGWLSVDDGDVIRALKEWESSSDRSISERGMRAREWCLRELSHERFATALRELSEGCG